MNKLFSSLKNIITGPSSPEKKQGDSLQTAPSINSEEMEAAFQISALTDRINCALPNAQDQLAARLEAMKTLAGIGKKAEKALPVLVRKTFSPNLQERTCARGTIMAIDPQWAKNEIVFGEIPFLILQLNGNSTAMNNAKTMLLAIGQPAEKQLWEKLKDIDFEDPYFMSVCISLLSKLNPDKTAFNTLINNTIIHTEHSILLEACCEATCTSQLDEEETGRHISKIMVENSNAIVREKAAKAVCQNWAAMDWAISPMFKCLSDDSQLVRELAVAFFAKYSGEFPEELFYDVIKNKGKLKLEEFEDIFKKAHFWGAGRGDSGMTSTYNDATNNISWYKINIEKALNKPELLLSATLSILSKRNYANPNVSHHLKDIIDEKNTGAIKADCINILGNFIEEKENMLPFLVGYLSHSSALVRDAAVLALDKLDSHWLSHPIAAEKLELFIHDLDNITRSSSKEAIISLGERAVNLLTEQLEKTDKRVLQQTIIGILDNYGNSQIISLPALLRVKGKLTNIHTIMAIEALIKKLEKA